MENKWVILVSYFNDEGNFVTDTITFSGNKERAKDKCEELAEQKESTDQELLTLEEWFASKEDSTSGLG